MAEFTGSTEERLEKVLDAIRENRRSSLAHVWYHLWGRVWRRHASYRPGMSGLVDPAATPASAPATP